MRWFLGLTLAFHCLIVVAAKPVKDKRIYYQGTVNGTYNFYVGGKRVAYTRQGAGDSVELHITPTKVNRHGALVLTVTPRGIEPVDLPALHLAIDFNFYTEERFIHVMQSTPDEAIIRHRELLPDMEPNIPRWTGLIDGEKHTVTLRRQGGVPGIEARATPFKPGDVIKYEANANGGYTFKLGDRTLLYTEAAGKDVVGQVLFRPNASAGVNVLIGHWLTSKDGDGVYVMFGGETTDPLLDAIKPILSH